eukprot:1567108-Pleurochrysis_carterae.AAC.3
MVGLAGVMSSTERRIIARGAWAGPYLACAAFGLGCSTEPMRAPRLSAARLAWKPQGADEAQTGAAN